jgi:hypothetical protein
VIDIPLVEVGEKKDVSFISFGAVTATCCIVAGSKDRCVGFGDDLTPASLSNFGPILAAAAMLAPSTAV